MTDPLTQTWNRAGLGYFGPVMVKEAASGGKTLGVMYADLDHFNAINDRHGHSVGDQVIVQAARRLKAVLRVDNVLVKHGGEEFLILVLVHSADELAALAKRAREVILKSAFNCDGHVLRMTLSIGTTLKRDEEQLDIAISRADIALYRAKANGRNCVDAG